MDKLAAEVRKAEVRGFVAALVDTGIIKCAEDEVAVVEDIIEEHLPEEYNMEDAMAIAADVVDALDANAEAEAEGGEVVDPELVGDPEMVVEASDKTINKTAAMAAYGELSMAKEAGEITAEEFEKEALSLQGMLASARGGAKNAYTGNIGAGLKTVGSKVTGAGQAVAARMPKTMAAASQVRAGLTGDGIKRNLSALKYQRSHGGTGMKAESLAKSRLLGSVARTGAVYGGVAGAGLGGKALYDKYNQ